MAAEMTTCGGCGYATAEPFKKCPRCGRAVPAPKNWRVRGWIQIFMGLILIVLMGAVTFNLAPSMLRAGERVDGGSFTGTPEQGLLILGLFGLIITFGLGSVASGLWQIVTGRRNNWMFAIMLALFALVMLAAWLTTSSLKG